jgi:hypothetical protein
LLVRIACAIPDPGLAEHLPSRFGARTILRDSFPIETLTALATAFPDIARTQAFADVTHDLRIAAAEQGRGWRLREFERALHDLETAIEQAILGR